MANNTSSVTASLTLRNGDILITSTSTIGVGSVELEIAGSLTDLKNLIDATPDGGVIDLGGKCYALLPDGHPNASDGDYAPDGSREWSGIALGKNITFQNGYISFYRPVTPSVTPDGKSVVVSNDTNESFIFVFDPNRQAGQGVDPNPRFAMYPPPYNDYTYSYLVDKNSFYLMNPPEGDDRGELIIDPTDLSRFHGFKVYGNTQLESDIKSILDEVATNEGFDNRSAAAQGMGILFNRLPNQQSLDTIQSYVENQDGSIDIIWNTVTLPDQEDQYLREFNFFGRLTFGDYGDTTVARFARDDTTIIYTPADGAEIPSQLFIPRAFTTSEHCFKPTGNHNLSFENITLIGSGDLTGVRSGTQIYCVGSDSTVNLRNTKHYFGGSFYSSGVNANTVVAEDCGFYGPYERCFSGSSEFGATFNRCEFIGGNYKSSAIGRLNATNMGRPIPPLVVTNCFFNFSSNHGQAISSYAGSWINTTIKNNIFKDLARSLSLQWITNFDVKSVNDLAEYPGFACENNLFVMTKLPPQISSQSTIAYNGAPPLTCGMEVDPNSGNAWWNSLKDGNDGQQILGDNLSTDAGLIQKYQIRFTDGSLSNIQFKWQNPETDDIDGSDVLRLILDRYDFVDAENGLGDCLLEIEDRGQDIGQSDNEFFGEIEIFTPAHTVDGVEQAEFVWTTLDVIQSYVHKNFPPQIIKNNTITFTKNLVEQCPVFTFPNGFRTIADVIANGAININGASSGFRRGFSTGGSIIVENNIAMATSGFQHTKKAKSKSAWDPFSTPPLSVELPVDSDGCYFTRDLITRMNGETTLSNNMFFVAQVTSEGTNGFDSYSDTEDPNRAMPWSIEIPDLTSDDYSQGSLEYDRWSDLLDGIVFNFNEGEGTIEPLIGTNLGIQLSTYPSWNQLETLGKDWTDSFPPLTV